MAKIFCAIYITGRAGWGTGVLVFDDSGSVVGADAGGVTYDGYFKMQNGRMEGDVVVTIPAGTEVVTGAPAPSQTYQFKVPISIGIDQLHAQIPVSTPIGPVQIELRRLRATA